MGTSGNWLVNDVFPVQEAIDNMCRYEGDIHGSYTTSLCSVDSTVIHDLVEELLQAC